jgi:hypothetical protein
MRGKNEAPHTGTTIVACEYDGGVVLGADTRVSTGTLRVVARACVIVLRARWLCVDASRGRENG